MPYVDYPSLPSPYINKNAFRGRSYELQPVPPFDQVKNYLPAPILPDHPTWERMYWRAWEMLWDNLQRPSSGSTLVSPYFNHATGGGPNMWATAFSVLMSLYARRAFSGIDALDNFYAAQHDDGFICREMDKQGHDCYYAHDPNSTGPNILAWAEWRYYRLTGDDSRLREAFWPLLDYSRWLQKNRTWPNGLYWTTGISSGMINQTRIAGQVEESMYHHCHWSWVDANMQAALNTWILGEIAVMLNEKELAASLSQEHLQLLQEINARMWNDSAAFYHDISPSGSFSPVKSIGAYWGLLAQGMVAKERQTAFIKHLMEPDSFKRPHRIPAQSADSPGYDAESGSQWRGGVWSPTNYMVLKGLRASGRHALAHEIAMNHLENVGRVFERTGTFWENYEPETAAPGHPAEADYVGWSGLSPINILLEDVTGIMVDCPQSRVIWDRRYNTNAFFGVRNYPIGKDGMMDLIGDKETVTITTSLPLTLVIQDEEINLQTAVPVGSTEIAL
jgi:hypothetical protein